MDGLKYLFREENHKNAQQDLQKPVQPEYF